MPEPFTRSSRSQPAARWPDRPRSSRPRSTETGRPTEPRPDHPGRPEPATATATAGSTAASIQSCNLETSFCDDRRPPSQFLVKFQAEQKNASFLRFLSESTTFKSHVKKQKDSCSNSRKKVFQWISCERVFPLPYQEDKYCFF